MLNWIFGTITVLTDERGLNLAAKDDIQCTDIIFNDQGVSFRISLHTYLRLKTLFEKNDIEYKTVDFQGLPLLVYNFRKRIGLILGIAIFFILITISQKYIWSFNIIGNDRVTENEIIDILTELGCGVGTEIKGIEFDMLHNDFLIKCEDISWISVNVVGTTANVEVTEVKRGEKDSGQDSNIIAAEDGQINLITVERGKSQVKIGDVVKKGDILISGVETYREGEKTYFVHAEGEVLATVNRTFSVEVNNIEQNKVYTGEEKNKYTVKFFGFSLNLFSNSGILYDKYDTIIKNRQLILFDAVKLPIWIESTEFCEYTEEQKDLAEEEVKAIAIREYREKINEMTKDSELISISTSHIFENGVYRIDCNLYCIADIAANMPFTIVNEE